jgi:hypothetical protein
MPCKTGLSMTVILFIKTVVILHPQRNSSFTILMNRIPVIDTPVEIVSHIIQEFLNNTRRLSDSILNKLWIAYRFVQICQ